MSAGGQRAALDALNMARPVVARLDVARDKEDLAADIIEAWGMIETGLRSLIGGSALGGQSLIRELRQRHFLNLEQANALAEFNAARERAAQVNYTPTAADANAARDAFIKLEAGLMGEPSPTPTVSMAGAVPLAATGDAALDPNVRRTSFPNAEPVLVATPSRRSTWALPVAGLIVLLIVGGLAWWMFAGKSGSASYDEGVKAYREGRKEAAAGAFLKATRDNPNDPMPHVFLARMAREAGNLNTANSEAVKAVQLGPNNGAALRELGSALFAQTNFDGARTFFIRAIKADSTDRLSQGYLGCSLIRLGRIQEGTRWVQRAGTGAWQGCVPAPGTVPAGAIPPAPIGAPVPMTQGRP